jgi:hypothetical protein
MHEWPQASTHPPFQSHIHALAFIWRPSILLRIRWGWVHCPHRRPGSLNRSTQGHLPPPRLPSQGCGGIPPGERADLTHVQQPLHAQAPPLACAGCLAAAPHMGLQRMATPCVRVRVWWTHMCWMVGSVQVYHYAAGLRHFYWDHYTYGKQADKNVSGGLTPDASAPANCTGRRSPVEPPNLHPPAPCICMHVCTHAHTRPLPAVSTRGPCRGREQQGADLWQLCCQRHCCAVQLVGCHAELAAAGGGMGQVHVPRRSMEGRLRPGLIFL